MSSSANQQIKKKKSKSPIKIKLEHTKELFTLEHYVGEPVELIKQIFNSLNTKTIKRLCPEFMKKSTIAEIEELCLNELLGISTKRLKSIINATKCPTDTESDEAEDSDVQNIDEHISLEEISSDSGNERKSKARKRKSKMIANIKTKDKNGKEMSVLELLELQARARAIRSQLALEPIAKIEVHSEESDATESNISSAKPAVIAANVPSPPPEKVRKKQTTSSTITTKSEEVDIVPTTETNMTVNGDNILVASKLSENRARKIKLKRNFRKHSPEKIEVTINNKAEEKVPSPVEPIKDDMNEIETNRLEGSISPDVLTIMPNYEVFCISDSDDEQKIKARTPPKTSETKIDPVIIENSKITEYNVDQPVTKPEDLLENVVTPATVNEVVEELEDGEIVDVPPENEPEIKNADNLLEEQQTEVATEVANDEENVKDEEIKKVDMSDDVEVEEINSKNVEVIQETEVDDDDDDDDHNNDDIISLGDEDLDYEMQNDMENEVAMKKEIIEIDQQTEEILNEPEKPNLSTPEIDFIDLHDSSDEETAEKFNTENQSWNSRWLESSKVSKILATSKLANRVRDKLKKDRKAEQELQQLAAATTTPATNEETDPQNSPKVIFSSNFEDGSIQQYKEIMDREKNEPIN